MWKTYEHDRFRLAETEQTQKTTTRINGMRNKYIGRVLMCKSQVNPNKDIQSATAIVDSGNLVSVANWKEKIQCRVNGRDLFGDGGLGGEKVMDVLGMLHDTWGEITMPPFGNDYGCGVDYNADIALTTISSRVEPTMLQKRAYIGFPVEEMANDFQVIYERNTIKDEVSDTNADMSLGNGSNTTVAQNVDIYYEVVKKLNIRDGKYQVSY